MKEYVLSLLGLIPLNIFFYLKFVNFYLDCIPGCYFIHLFIILLRTYCVPILLDAGDIAEKAPLKKKNPFPHGACILVI